MRKLIYLVIFLFISTGIYAQTKDLVQYVNTLQGTDSHFGLSYGNTYPTTGMPYAMHTWSAQTGKNGEGWKYQYAVDAIRGFCQSHQCSPWMSDYAVYSFMPMVGELVVNQDKRATKFSHDNEIAKPHYYKVTLNNGITTEMAPTTRGVHLRFSYPSTGDAYLVIDGYTDMSEIKIDPAKRQISGWVNNQRFVNNSKTFRSYFVVQFDKAFEDYGVWENQKDEIFSKKQEGAGKGYGAYIKFKKGSKVQAKAASSYISAEQAVITLNNELGKDSNLETTKARGQKTWNELLNRIQVEGGTEEQMKTFYSCLFRANLFSRKFYERKANGEPYYYSPYDGKVYDGYMYTDNGFWDTFRAVHPLFTLLYPEVSERVTQSILNAYDESGFMPEWASPGHRECMIGNNSISLLTDAWMKGIRTICPEKALEAMIHQTEARHPGISSVGRDGFGYYDRLGYVPYPEVHEATAKTLEYAYADWCVARFADSIGRKEIADTYYRKALNYRNLYYPDYGFMWAKDANGKWRDAFDATEWGGPFTEGSSWHWTWSVLHDPEGLSRLMGGHAAMEARLDSMFTAPNTYNYGTYGFVIHEIAEMVALDMGQYAHGNQPVQHAIYLYDYIGRPWKAQKHVREVMDKLYHSGSKGYCGDEDNGQTSAWYVFSAMGFYPVCPGVPEYAMGSPLFPKLTLHLPDGKNFTVKAEGNSPANRYIGKALLNESEFTRNYLTHRELTSGGELVLWMDSVPDSRRGTQKEDLPYSYSNGH